MSHDASARFATTRWSLVRAAHGESLPSARAALEELCGQYWYPLYAHARRRGYDVASAEDLTQGFFAQLLERQDLAKADPRRGRFRTFLLTAFQHFMLNEWERSTTLKRGGGHTRLSLDVARAEQLYAAEPQFDAPPERLFARRWAIQLLDHVREQLRIEYAESGRRQLYESLEAFLTGEPSDATFAELAQPLGMTAGSLKVACHRLRRRFGERLREEISHTLDDPQDVDDEIRDLFHALRG